MWRYVTKRVVCAVATLLVVVTIAFFAINLLLPYDFAIGLAGREGAAQQIREVLAFGLTIALAGGIVLRAWARKNGRRVLAVASLPLALSALVVALLSLGVWADAIDSLTLPSADGDRRD